jgi:hypothetical protein
MLERCGDDGDKVIKDSVACAEETPADSAQSYGLGFYGA